MCEASALASRRGGALFVAAWTLAVVTGAFLLRRYADSLPAPVVFLADIEAFHIVAHVFLYGTLTLGSARLLPRPGWAAPLLTMSVAFVQEAAQVWPFGRAIGWAGTFDLAVDATAMAAALLWIRRREREAQPGA